MLKIDFERPIGKSSILNASLRWRYILKRVATILCVIADIFFSHCALCATVYAFLEFDVRIYSNFCGEKVAEQLAAELLERERKAREEKIEKEKVERELVRRQKEEEKQRREQWERHTAQLKKRSSTIDEKVVDSWLPYVYAAPTVLSRLMK